MEVKIFVVAIGGGEFIARNQNLTIQNIEACKVTLAGKDVKDDFLSSTVTLLPPEPGSRPP